MRELYTAPELKLISFVPHENIAVFSFDFDDASNGVYAPVEEEDEVSGPSIEVS